MRIRPLALLAAALFCAGAQADQPQSLTAKIDGAAFAGDDDTIVLVPLPSGAFTLNAATAGAAGWPPPKTPIQRLSIVCEGYAPGRPFKLGSADFARSSCDATLRRESGKDVDEYAFDKASPANAFEVTAAHGKVIEGRFELHFKDKAGRAVVVGDGRFVAEDRQL